MKLKNKIITRLSVISLLITLLMVNCGGSLSLVKKSFSGEEQIIVLLSDYSGLFEDKGYVKDVPKYGDSDGNAFKMSEETKAKILGEIKKHIQSVYPKSRVKYVLEDERTPKSGMFKAIDWVKIEPGARAAIQFTIKDTVTKSPKADKNENYLGNLDYSFQKQLWVKTFVTSEDKEGKIKWKENGWKVLLIKNGFMGNSESLLPINELLANRTYLENKTKLDDSKYFTEYLDVIFQSKDK